MPVTSRSARTGTAPPPRPRPSPPSATPSSARSGSSASPASPPSCAPPDGTLTGSRSSSSASPGPGPRHPHDASPRQKRDPENAARQKPRKPQLRDQHKKRQLRQTATQGPTLQTPCYRSELAPVWVVAALLAAGWWGHRAFPHWWILVLAGSCAATWLVATFGARIGLPALAERIYAATA